jgi:hypothetical protein
VLIGALGIRLILWVGPTVPLPAPPGVMKALTEVTVTNDSEGQDGFQLTLTLGKSALFDFGVLSDGTFDPLRRVVIGVLMGASPEVLIDGVVTHHQVVPGSDPGTSTMTVTGKDLTQVLDLDERNVDYPNQPDFVIFTRLVATYPQYGLVPTPTPTADVPIMLQRIPRQHETDLQFIRRMAERNGFVFYVEPVTFGVNKAYFGPETRVGAPQAALTQNLGPATNVRSLSFSNDAMAPVGTRGTFVDPIFKLPIPIPSLPSLRLPPLSRGPAPAYRTVQLRDTANENPARAATAAAATVTRAPDPIEGSGELDAARYGSVLRARRLVGVRGAGTTYDGFYWVKRVTHTIKPGSYTQGFTLSREGTGALLPVVVP